jgi:hypothetical protein
LRCALTRCVDVCLMLRCVARPGCAARKLPLKNALISDSALVVEHFKHTIRHYHITLTTCARLERDVIQAGSQNVCCFMVSSLSNDAFKRTPGACAMCAPLMCCLPSGHALVSLMAVSTVYFAMCTSLLSNIP